MSAISLYDLIQFIFGLLAAIGSFLTVLSALNLSKEDIFIMSQFSFGGNAKVVKSLTEQKSQQLVGGVYFLLSFIVLGLNSAFQPITQSYIFNNRSFLLSLAFFCFILILFVSIYGANLMAKNSQKKLKSLTKEQQKALIAAYNSEVQSESL